MERQTFQLKISPDKEMIAIALSAAKEYASRYIDDPKEVNKMGLALEEAIANVLNFSMSDSVESIKIYAEAKGGELKFSVIDKGLPGDFNDMLKDEDSLGLTIMQKVTDRITIKNLGLKGRCQELVKYISKVPDFEAEQKKEIEPIKPKEIKIIPLRRSDADWVARGIYSEYGFSYPNDIVYYPDRFYEAVQNGSIHSIVAVDEEGRFLGHVGASQWSDIPGIYESGMAVVNPACRGAGVFNLLVTTLDAQVRALPDAKQNLGEAVTTHTFSQKGGYKSGSRATGFVFCMTPPESGLSTFRSKQEKSGRQRDSYLYTPAVIDTSEKTVYSVPEISDITDFAYGILNLKRTVITDDIPPETEVSVGTSATKTTWDFSRITIYEIGKDIAERIKRDVLEAKRIGTEMIQLCLSMDKPGVYQAYEAAKSQGFFCTGILPVTGMGDVLLMANLFENMVDYENIQVLEQYKPLLEMVKKLDPDRN